MPSGSLSSQLVFPPASTHKGSQLPCCKEVSLTCSLVFSTLQSCVGAHESACLTLPLVHKLLPQLPRYLHRILWIPPSNWELITSQGRVMKKVSLPPAPYSHLILFK